MTEDKKLEQLAQEPVGYVTNSGLSAVFNLGVNLDDDTPLYTNPASSWQGLSNDMVRAIGEKCEEKNRGILNWIDFYNGIENMLKDKNS